MKHSAKGSNSQKTKELNRRLILKLISTTGPISRIELSRRTGLSKMSVTNIVNELMESHFISELKELPKDFVQETSAGRTPILLETTPGTLLAMGIYISRDFCNVSIIDIKGGIYAQNRTNFSKEESENTFIHKIIHSINHLLEEVSLTPDNLLGIGIASIGPLDIPNGIILEPPNFHGLTSIKLVDVLKGFYQCPIYINNDIALLRRTATYSLPRKSVQLENKHHTMVALSFAL